VLQRVSQAVNIVQTPCYNMHMLQATWELLTCCSEMNGKFQSTLTDWSNDIIMLFCQC